MEEPPLTEELGSRMVIYFAEQLGISSDYLAALLDGYDRITPDIALKLAHFFPDTSPTYWMRLQKP